MSASDRVPDQAPRAALWASANEAILEAFADRTAHDGGATAHRYRKSVASQLRRYARQHGVPEPALRDVLTDADLFERVLAVDRSLRGSGWVSRKTVKVTRQAFAALIAALPPPPGVTRDALRCNLATARRATERTVGLRRIATIGETRPRRFVVPSAAEVTRVVAALRATLPPGHPAADLVAFLYLVGIRLGAALALTTADLREMPDGTAWVHVWEKARPDARPVLVRPEQAALALAWQQLPSGAPLWVVDGEPIRPHKVRAWITRGCERATVARFTPHALRRAFARDLAPYLGLVGTQRAGGWLAARVLEDYIDAGRQGSA